MNARIFWENISETNAKNNSMKHKPLIALILTIAFAKLIGGARDVMFLSVFGSSETSMVYEGTERFVSLFFDITVGGACAALLIPLLSDIRVRYSWDSSSRFAAFYMLAVQLLSLLCVIAAVTVNAAFGICNDRLLFFILLPRIFISGFMFTLGAYLNFHSVFVLCSIVNSLPGVVAVLYLSLKGIGIYRLCAIETIFMFVSSVILLIRARKCGLRLKAPCLPVGKYMKNFVSRLLPCALSLQFMPTATLLGIMSVMKSDRGMILSYSFGMKIFMAVAGIFILSYMQILYPRISDMVSAGLAGEGKKKSMISILYIFLLSFAGIVLFCIAGKEVIYFVFCHGNFEKSSCDNIFEIVKILLLSMPAFGAGEVALKFSFAKKHETAMMSSGVLSLIPMLLVYFFGENNSTFVAYAFVFCLYTRAIFNCILAFGRNYDKYTAYNNGLERRGGGNTA